jgi:hypothetical protein
MVVPHCRITLGLIAPLVHSEGASRRSSDLAPSSRLPSYVKDPAAKKRVETSVGDFAFWVDEAKWKQHKPQSDGVLEFSHVSKGGLGVKVIAEDTSVPMSRLRDLVIANFRRAAEKVKVTFEDKRTVNGRHVLALQVSATIKGIPAKYWGYYYGGSSGTIQAIGWMVGTAITNDNVEELTTFLNGIEISDEDLSPTGVLFPGLLSLNSSISIMYDPQKWKQDHSSDDTDDGRFTFKPSSGEDDDEIGVLVLADRTELPDDALPKFVLSNFRDSDPNARIIQKKRRRMNGAKLWFLKITVTVDKETATIFSYCYSGKAGTIQVHGIVEASLLHKYEKDLMEFLNGLLVSE